MNKIFIVLCAIFAVAAANYQEHGYGSQRTDEFIKKHRLQFADILRKQQSEFEKFTDLHLVGKESITIQNDLLAQFIAEQENYLNPLELLSALSSSCVVENRPVSKYIINVPRSLQVCIERESVDIEKLLEAANNIHNNMEKFIKESLDGLVDNCTTSTHDPLSVDYTDCITNEITKISEQVAHQQKELGYALDEANCKSKELNKKTNDCVNGVHKDVYTKYTESKININNCMSGSQLKCEPCAPKTCDEEVHINVNYVNETIPNPFLGRSNNARSCLVLRPIET